MPFVLDASMAAAWALPDEANPKITAVLLRMHADAAMVPAIWWFEIRNTLIVNERRSRITPLDTARFLERLARLIIDVDRFPDEAAVLRFARKYRLTVYDAAYLELAQRTGLPLATLDSELAAAAHSENVKIIGGN